jgi:glycosyltransferase involved in cell wall biosynthesis
LSAPLLTVVVPVHRVEKYLHQCLDSVLADDRPEIEIVAVDDCSPDRCGELLDEYARLHDRVRVLHLAENVGLGPARNAGLAQARGRYVWFVDSDDWLPAGSVAAVLDRLTELNRPGRRPVDVLLVDHLRAYSDGGLLPDPSSRLLRAAPEHPLAGLAEHPELISVQHTAWNKVLRRAFLTEAGLSFQPGWYEDCSFSHPALIAAARIGVLDRVCYDYRQRSQGGAITRTSSPRHLEVFDQYEWLFGWLDRNAHRAAPWRPHVFQLMINHYIVIVGNEERVPVDLRRTFFRRMAAHYHEFRPAAGYPRPAGLTGVKHRLVGWGAFGLYAGLRRSYRAVRGVRARLRRPVEGSTTTPTGREVAHGLA